MSEKEKKDEEKSRGSGASLAFWTTLPGILTGVAALITALGGLYLATRNNSSNNNRQTNVVSSTPAATATPGTSQGLDSDSGECFAQYFAEVPQDRLINVEVGSQNVQIIRPDQSKSGDVGIRLTSFDKPVGAVKFIATTNRSATVFRIKGVVDGKCQKAEELINDSRGGDPTSLQNWDTLKARIGGHTYTLRLKYSAGAISADLNEVVP